MVWRSTTSRPTARRWWALGLSLAVVAILALPSAGAFASAPMSHGTASLPQLIHPSALPHPRPARPATTLDGVDVSSYQGTINWATVYSDGVTFAFAKAAEGNEAGCDDSDWVGNAVNGKAAGVYIGAYDFAEMPSGSEQACSSGTGADNATAEANTFDAEAGPYFASGYMYPALDMEQGCAAEGDGSETAAEMSHWIGMWMATVEAYIKANDGYTIVPSIYMSASYASSCIDSWITEFPLWVANWGVSSPGTGLYSTWSYWQYNDDCTTCGVAGDADYFNGDVAQLQSGFVFGSGGGGGPAPISATYTANDTTTSTSLSCGDTIAAGDTITFSAAITGGTPPYTSSWAFGDGTMGSGTTVTHVYTSAGSVNPILTAKDKNGNTTTSGTGCDFTVTGSAPPPHVTVTADVAPSASAGQVTINGTTLSNGGTISLRESVAVPLVAVVPAGYTFSDWTVTGGLAVGSSAATTTTLTPGASAGTVTMNLVAVTPPPGHVDITVATTPADEGQVTINGTTVSDGGSVSLLDGATVSLVAVVPAGYNFSGWMVPNTVILGGPGASTTLTVGANNATVTMLLTASPSTSSLTVTNDPTDVGTFTVGGTTVTPGTPTTVTEGSATTLVATPSLDWGFTSWSVVSGTALLGSSTSPSTTVTVESSAATVLAVFHSLLPSAPQALTVKSVGTSWIDLSWTPPPGTMVNTTVAWAAGASAPSTGWTTLSVTGTTSVANVTGLTAATTYWFRVQAWNASGAGPWSTDTSGVTLALPAGPGTPTALSIVGDGPTWVLLSWKAPTSGATVTGYLLQYGGVPGNFGSSLSAGASTLTENVTGLTANTTYEFEVIAEAGTSESSPSNTVQVTTPSASTSGGNGHGSGQNSTSPGLFSFASLTSPLVLALIVVLLVIIVVAAIAASRRRGPPATPEYDGSYPGYPPAGDPEAYADGSGDVPPGPPQA